MIFVNCVLNAQFLYKVISFRHSISSAGMEVDFHGTQALQSITETSHEGLEQILNSSNVSFNSSFESITATSHEGIEQILNSSNASSNSSFEFNTTAVIPDSDMQDGLTDMQSFAIASDGAPPQHVIDFATKARRWYRDRWDSVRRSHLVTQLNMVNSGKRNLMGEKLDEPLRGHDDKKAHTPEGLIVWLWHATTRKRYAGILKEGFKPGEQHGTMGSGRYFSPVPTHAIRKAQFAFGEEGSVVYDCDSMILAAPVKLGTVIEVGDEELDESLIRRIVKDGPYSLLRTRVANKHLNGAEWDIGHSDQIDHKKSIPFTVCTEQQVPILKKLAQDADHEREEQNFVDRVLSYNPCISKPSEAEPSSEPTDPSGPQPNGCLPKQHCCSCTSDWWTQGKIYDKVYGKHAGTCCDTPDKESPCQNPKHCLMGWFKAARASHYWCVPSNNCKQPVAKTQSMTRSSSSKSVTSTKPLIPK